MEPEFKDLFFLKDTGPDFIPKSLDQYIGQDELKSKLSVYIKAANMRNEPLDHLLLFGPAGLGKTTLSQIIAESMNSNIKICSGPTLERSGDIVSILSSLEERDVLFIDEIHRMAITVEEVLYSAMEQYRVDVILGQGAGAKSINLPISRFTLIGATTQSGLLSAPLRSRFGIVERLEYYDNEELATILIQSANFLQIDLEKDGALLIAQASRGTPRIGKKLLRRVRDFAQVANKKKIDSNLVLEILSILKIDDQGLTLFDINLLKTIIEKFDGGPVGLDTLSSILSESSETIESVYEPYLMRIGYLQKTPRGRQIPHKILPYLQKKFNQHNNI